MYLSATCLSDPSHTHYVSASHFPCAGRKRRWTLFFFPSSNRRNQLNSRENRRRGRDGKNEDQQPRERYSCRARRLSGALQSKKKQDSMTWWKGGGERCLMALVLINQPWRLGTRAPVARDPLFSRSLFCAARCLIRHSHAQPTAPSPIRNCWWRRDPVEGSPPRREGMFSLREKEKKKNFMNC